MSDKVDTHAIVYRALVASFAEELTPEQIYHVAFIWLKGKGDISEYSPSRKPTVYGLELFAKLECLGVFSRKKIDGLLEIAKHLNRYDLVEKVKSYQKNRGDSYGIRYAKKKGLSRSEERQHLEQTFETMVTRMALLEQQASLLQSTLQKKPDSDFQLLDEGVEIIQKSDDIVQELASNFSKLLKRFARRSRTDSTASGSSDSSKRSSGDVDNTDSLLPLGESDQNSSSTQDRVLPPGPVNTTPVQVTPQRKPIPKPRSQKARPPIQESTGNVQLLHPSVESNAGYTTNDKQTSRRQPPPVAPKKFSYKSNPRHTATPHTHHFLLTVPKDMLLAVTEEVAIEEDDQTGDSGMGTGSGTGQYEALDEWKGALQNPPPERREHSYMPIRRETTDEDGLYQVLERN